MVVDSINDAPCVETAINDQEPHSAASESKSRAIAAIEVFIHPSFRLLVVQSILKPTAHHFVPARNYGFISSLYTITLPLTPELMRA